MISGHNEIFQLILRQVLFLPQRHEEHEGFFPRKNKKAKFLFCALRTHRGKILS